jgi:D-amino peptidase
MPAMRVMLFCDMEGVAGIQTWEQVNGGAPQYEEARRLYTAEVNAAVRGARRGGAKEVIVVDGHGAGGGWQFKSLLPERLERGAEYVFGHRWGCYVEPLADCDAVLLPGAHAMAGTPDGVLCHTMYSEAWYNAWINGTLVGESGILAAIAGSFDVPVIFVSGDEAVCREVTALLGKNVVAAPVKKGITRYSARTLTHGEACERIEERAARAVRGRARWPKPWKVAPAVLRVELASADKAAAFVGKTGVERVGPRILESRAATFWEAWDQFWPQTT